MIKVIILNDEQLPNRLCCGCDDNDRKIMYFKEIIFFIKVQMTIIKTDY